MTVGPSSPKSIRTMVNGDWLSKEDGMLGANISELGSYIKNIIITYYPIRCKGTH
ncbi:MAG: hypothetical protein R3D88_00550 [Alphaproteobacteria bacterium]